MCTWFGTGSGGLMPVRVLLPSSLILSSLLLPLTLLLSLLSKYRLPGSCVIPLPKRTDWAQAPDFAVGSKVSCSAAVCSCCTRSRILLFPDGRRDQALPFFSNVANRSFLFCTPLLPLALGRCWRCTPATPPSTAPPSSALTGG